MLLKHIFLLNAFTNNRIKLKLTRAIWDETKYVFAMYSGTVLTTTMCYPTY